MKYYLTDTEQKISWHSFSETQYIYNKPLLNIIISVAGCIVITQCK